MPCSRARDLQNHSPAEVLCDAMVATLISMNTPVYVGLVHRLGCLPNLLQEMCEYVRYRVLLETVYARAPHASQRHPKSTTAICLVHALFLCCGGFSNETLHHSDEIRARAVYCTSPRRMMSVRTLPFRRRCS